MVNVWHGLSISGYNGTLFPCDPSMQHDFEGIRTAEHCVWSPAREYLMKGVP